MNQAAVIFPHQLFASHPALSPGRPVYLVEDQLFFYDYRQKIKYHKKKLILHRASMRYFKDRLETEGFQVHYWEFQNDPEMAGFFEQLIADQIQKIWIADVVDSELERRLFKGAKKAKIELFVLQTPAFLTEKDWLERFFGKAKHYSQTQFYVAQRKRLGILMDMGKPQGGKWSYDPLNRRKIPKGLKIPEIPALPENVYLKEAKEYVTKNFSAHPGSVEGFPYPVTHEDSLCWLDDESPCGPSGRGWRPKLGIFLSLYQYCFRHECFLYR